MRPRLETPIAVDVATAEYVRLLGYPRGWELEGRALELAEWARDWYRVHGRPWILTGPGRALASTPQGITIDGEVFSSGRLSAACRDAHAREAVIAAVGAGPELEQEAHRCWTDGRPDEYFFLEVYGSAVVEYLVTLAGARLCAWADGHGRAVLPHDSPGYPGWPIDEQARLLAMLNAGLDEPAAVEVLPSGMLRPKKSLLAVFGVTTLTDRVRRLTDLVPCTQCAYQPCQFRRAPYGRTPEPVDPELAGAPPGPIPLTADARYSVNLKALRRWADERLTIGARPDGRLDARFRFEGTTCTNMGRPLAFDYHVVLGPRDDGYRVLDQTCQPAAGDEGHRHMCRFQTGGEALLAAIADERPLLGRPLDDVLTWTRPVSPAGCYCEATSRTHKWGLVLETVHYALVRREGGGPR